MNKRTPLHNACEQGFSEVVAILIKAGADVNYKDASGQTAIHYAVKFNHPPLIPQLKQGNSNLNAKDMEGLTALHIAANKVEPPLVSGLLENGADANIADVSGTIPLHIACELNNLPIVQLLIDANSDVLKKGKEGNTPLHYASLNMNKHIVELLIKKGAGPSAKEYNDNQRTPLNGIRLTFAKFMRNLLGEEDRNKNPDDDKIDPGDILNQSGGILESHSELKDSFCLLCRRRQATSALLPCGHLCVCETCQRERVATVKTCPICKSQVYGACSILSEI